MKLCIKTGLPRKSTVSLVFTNTLIHTTKSNLDTEHPRQPCGVNVTNYLLLTPQNKIIHTCLLINP